MQAGFNQGVKVLPTPTGTELVPPSRRQRQGPPRGDDGACRGERPRRGTRRTAPGKGFCPHLRAVGSDGVAAFCGKDGNLRSVLLN